MALRERRGKWHFRYMLDGVAYSGSTGLASTKRNENQARQIEADHRRALLEGRNPDTRVLVRQFNDAAQEFLAVVQAQHRDHPNTYDRIKTSFASLKEFFGTTPVTMVNTGRIIDYKSWRANEHKVLDITIRHDLHALSKFFSYAVDKGYARTNPLLASNRKKDLIPSDKDAERIHVITTKEEREYFQRAAKNRDLHDLARLMRLQGMRPEEVLELEKVNIDLDRGTLKIVRGKSKAARRTLYLTPESKIILGRRMTGISPWVFPSKNNPHQHRCRLNGAHDALLAKAAKDGVKLNFVLYDFRHSFATKMAEAGMDLGSLGIILGHTSVRVTQRYVHPSEDHVRAAMLRCHQVIVEAEAAKQEQEQEQSAERPN